MFRDACAIARDFTLPVILCRKDMTGKCSTTIGSFVVINEKGWIVTAGHIVMQHGKMYLEAQAAREWEREYEAIKQDSTINAKEKSRRLSKLTRPAKNSTDRCVGVWANWPGKPMLVESSHIEAADIGIGRLEPFDPNWIKRYPVFKDPSKDFEPGISLCKMGFPFHSVSTNYNAAKNVFELPPGTFPAPFFPIEGIFTRVAQIVVPGAPPSPIPLLWVETSSPGLKGQSGGPTFDSRGTVYAIQCKTSPYPLDFDGVPNQYLHAGLGVHPETIFGLFNKFKIDYKVSDY